MFFQSLTRLRAGITTDRGGNQIPDWSPGAVFTLEIFNVSVQPTVQSESTDPTRTSVVTGWRVLSAPETDADVRAGDRIQWDGMTLEVDGEVARWPHPLGAGVHHIEFAMKRATG